MNYREYIAKLINNPYVSADDVVEADDLTHGDFALPCFKYARDLRKSPQMIAAEFASNIKDDNLISKTEVMGGYLNFYLSRSSRIKSVLEELDLEAELAEIRRENTGKTVCIDYSSINIAKPFHIGHLMSTAIGASLYQIYKYLGYNPIGINHLGDWGTQFGKLIAAYKMWSSREKLDAGGLNELLALYVRFTEESGSNPELVQKGRDEFLKIERGESEALKLFTLFKEITLKEVGEVYELLGIKFDSYNGESFYNDKMQPIIDELEGKKLIKISDGAKIVDLEDFGMPPCLITRSDGATLYATRDLAAAVYRKNTYSFYKSLYVVASQQNLHFEQVFKVLELMGKEWAKDCRHVKFGLVSYNGKPLSTRQGHIVFLRDVIDTTVEKALAIIEEKNPELKNKSETAKSVGIGAVMFFALGTQRIRDIDFNYDKVLSFEGETAPYLQYTNARCNSIFARSSLDYTKDIDYSRLTDDESYAVISLIGKLNDILLSALDKSEPSIIAKYLIELAQSFNRFYLANKVITDDECLTKARLRLVASVSRVLKTGLSLLLINAPPQM